MCEAALALAGQGCPVFPCVVMGKRPATEHGLHDATTDRDAIQRWWRKAPYNIGCPTGILWDCIDVDGFEGITALEEWAEGKPECVRYIEPTVLTPSGGYHIYVPVSGIGNKVGWVPHCDYRGLGGYVVVPPSRTEKGLYQWV